MELLYLTLLGLIGTAFAEPSIQVIVSQQRVDPGTEVTVTCRVTDQGTSIAKLQKFIRTTDELTEDGNPKIYEEDVALNNALEKPYRDSGRHSVDPVENGNNGMDYILRIQNAQKEDTATYSCSIAGTSAYDAKNLEVYTKPQNVHFMNFSNWDLNVDILELEEGQKENVGCVAWGGVPLPRFEVVVGDTNYTSAFKHHESDVILPECFEEGSLDKCLLHYQTRSEVEAMEFRPLYKHDGQYLECKAYVDGSGLEPVVAKLKVMMSYTPKFHCFRKHKVAIHSANYEMQCSVLSNPNLDNVQFEFQWNGKNEVLTPGEKTDDGEIHFLPVNKISETETDVTLKFSEVFERHYDVQFKLMARNNLGDNSTMLELVAEDYERWSSANMNLYSGLLALIACLLALLMS